MHIQCQCIEAEFTTYWNVLVWNTLQVSERCCSSSFSETHSIQVVKRYTANDFPQGKRNVVLPAVWDGERQTVWQNVRRAGAAFVWLLLRWTHGLMRVCERALVCVRAREVKNKKSSSLQVFNVFLLVYGSLLASWLLKDTKKHTHEHWQYDVWQSIFMQEVNFWYVVLLFWEPYSQGPHTWDPKHLNGLYQVDKGQGGWVEEFFLSSLALFGIYSVFYAFY